MARSVLVNAATSEMPIPSQNMGEEGNRARCWFACDSGSRTISSGTWASGKARRSLVTHWRWSKAMRESDAKKSAKRNESQAPRGNHHADHGTEPCPSKNRRTASALVGANHGGRYWKNVLSHSGLTWPM